MALHGMVMPQILTMNLHYETSFLPFKKLDKLHGFHLRIANFIMLR